MTGPEPERLDAPWWQINRETLAAALSEHGVTGADPETVAQAIDDQIAANPDLRRTLEAIALEAMVEPNPNP